MLENGTFNEDVVASITNRSIRSVLEFPSPLLQYPMSSWHFLLIVGQPILWYFIGFELEVNLGNQLWVTVDPLFYLRPVFYLLWLHTVVWLSLLPAHDHCVWYQPLMAVYSGEWYPSSISAIPSSSYNEFHSYILSKPSFSLCYIQHHSLYEHHHSETGFVNTLWLFYQQPTSEWSLCY